ncbi:PLP-dependent transferase [bacterium]|nr:PLP-dependent transferase [bacterium]
MPGQGAGEPGSAAGPPRRYSQRSRFIHGEMYTPHWDYSHHVVPPMSASATYRLSSAARGALGFCNFASPELSLAEQAQQDIFIYDRLHEPTAAMLEERLAEAEGAGALESVTHGQPVRAVSFATGMAAISAALGIRAQSGTHVIAHNCLYGCTASLLRNWYPRLGIEVSFIDMTDLETLRGAIRPNTRLVYLESPVNPTLELIDLAGVAAVIAGANAGLPEPEQILSVCDNTFSTPVCQRPMEQGIDIVVHSLTKGIGGFGTDMGGVVIAPARLEPELLLYRKDFGGSLSPKAAWPPLVYGLPTLPVRMRQMQHSAGRIAEYLEAHPLVAKVRYPGLEADPQHALARKQMRGYDGAFMPGSMVYFTLKEAPGSNARAEAFIDYAADNSYCITLAVSLGQVKTLIENPCSMTHSAIPESERAAAGLESGGIRLSVGIEETSDIIADLEACFAHVASLDQQPAPAL